MRSLCSCLVAMVAVLDNASVDKLGAIGSGSPHRLAYAREK